jgi:hypothetical protein
MATRNDPLKLAIANLAFDGFKSGRALPSPARYTDSDPAAYDIITDEELLLQIRVRTKHGPRFFLIKVNESVT